MSRICYSAVYQEIDEFEYEFVTKLLSLMSDLDSSFLLAE